MGDAYSLTGYEVAMPTSARKVRILGPNQATCDVARPVILDVMRNGTPVPPPPGVE